MRAPVTSRRDAPVICAGCGHQVVRQARQHRFCSKRCRQKANHAVKIAGGYPTTARPTNPPKKDRKFKAVQQAKTLSTRRILAPANVLTVEVWGDRRWQPTTSSSGVPIEISRLRARALVSP
jgi:hypothetical protein